MSETDLSTTRLCLVTPEGADPKAFGPVLAAALSAGDVASLIITAEDSEHLRALAAALVPIAQAEGVAALIHNDAEIAKDVRADGVHLETGKAGLTAARSRLGRDAIVGAANLRSRHEAMSAGEADADYVFFGRLDGDTDAAIFPKALDLAAWWADLFEIPAIVMGGLSLSSVREASNAGIEFVALRRAVWEHESGPAAAVEEAVRLLSVPQDVLP